MIQPTIQEIHTALGDLIFGSGEDELEHAVSRLLIERRMTLASVEVGASSLFPDWMLAANENAGHYYAGGLAFPDVRASLNWLGGGVGSTNAEMHSDSSVLDEATCARLALLARSALDRAWRLPSEFIPRPHSFRTPRGRLKSFTRSQLIRSLVSQM